jgi:hypothetical protein
MDGNHDDAMRIDVRKGIEKDVINDAKDRSRGPDTKPESDDRYCGEATILSYASQSVFQILKNRTHFRHSLAGAKTYHDDIETNKDGGR